ncbi:MAG: amidase [Mesorhizobium sp.]
MTTDLCYLTATEAIGLFRARKLSPVELLSAYISRAQAVEPTINAFTDTYFDEAMAEAKAAEQRYMSGDAQTLRPLEGLPVAVKDAQRVAGKRTTYGSAILVDNVDDHSDPMIERLQGAGAIIHARTTTPEFCLSSSCNTKLWGRTLNPFNTQYGPGGSSGGSAASLAAGTSALATGTDIGGSIRIPASCCGLVGYKPPKGRNPDGPPANFDPYNHCGPLARSVADAALVQNVVSGPHPRDHSSLRDKVHVPDAFAPVRGMRIAWSMDLGYMPIDQEVREATLAALGVFRSLGCTVEEVDLGWTTECDKAALAWYNAMHFGRQPLWYLKDNEARMTDYAIAAAKAASRLSPDDVARSWETQNAMYQDFATVMETHDLFICPTNSLPALRADQDMADQNFTIDGQRADPEYGWILTHHFNMLHNCPVMSVPSGRAANGVPTGIQLVGPTFDDLTVFRAASAYEHAVGGWFGPDWRPAL